MFVELRKEVGIHSSNPSFNSNQFISLSLFIQNLEHLFINSSIMKRSNYFFPLLILLSFVLMSGGSVTSCSSNESKKVSQVELSPNVMDEDEIEWEKKYGKLPNRPNTVLQTSHNNHRLVTVYKEKYTKDGKRTYISGNYYHTKYRYGFEQQDSTNRWHGHYMPGIEAVYGFNMFNVSHYNIETKSQSNLFAKPVLIKTLYYPAEEQDTLNGTPIKRDFYLVSVYDEDTNNDTIINYQDLRRLYAFDLEGKNQTLLIPKNYSVIKSEYEHQNDVVYIFARRDHNKNGKVERTEPVEVFLIDLKNPVMGDKVY